VKAQVLDINKNAVGEIDICDKVFSTKTNNALIYETVKMQLACRRSGTAATKNRALMSGTTAKMYRQKGTGRARHGDKRANIFVGGGKAFGPHPRDYSYKMPKKARKAGIKSALSEKINSGSLVILDQFPDEKIKTKDAYNNLKKLGITSCLIVIRDRNVNLEKSIRNIPNIKLLRAEGINVYDILRYKHTVILKDAIEKVQEVLV